MGADRAAAQRWCRSRDLAPARPELPVRSGDIIEYDSPEGRVTAEVMLATAGTVILDLLDGTPPKACLGSRLQGVEVFHPDPDWG